LGSPDGKKLAGSGTKHGSLVRPEDVIALNDGYKGNKHLKAFQKF
jgi:hypothetical protein